MKELSLVTVEYGATSGVFMDVRRSDRTLSSSADREVEDNTALKLLEHVEEGLYSHGIKYHGITYRSVGAGIRGPNCVDSSYINIFVKGKDNFFHVYVKPPGRK